MLKDHRLLIAVLVGAALVRVAFAVTYAPALMFSDSWTYISVAFDHPFVGFAPDRPSGYGIVIEILSVAGRSLLLLTTLQHLAGLIVGVLVYVLLLRLDAPPWCALVACAIVVFDGYLITLEQTVLPEAFFTLALMVSVLAVALVRSPGALAASGLLLAVAATMRTAALFAVPFYLGYVAWSYRSWPRVGIACAAIAAPVLAYSAAHAVSTGSFGMTEADGWFLYGRVAEIADGCDPGDVEPDARVLCERRTELDDRNGALFHIWNPQSVANRHFDGILSGDDEQDRTLRTFALEIIKDRPVEYVALVAADFGRYFVPGVRSLGTSDHAIEPPRKPRNQPPFINAAVRDEHLRDYQPRVREPGTAVRAYARAIHTPRWLMGICALVSLLAVAASIMPRLRSSLPRAPEVLLLSGCALGMLLGSAATSEFVVRYLVPSVPLLLGGGVLAAIDIGRALNWRSAPE